jgi:hypothetical protein
VPHIQLHRIGALRQLKAEIALPSPDLGGLATLLEALFGELANCLEHAKPRLGVWLVDAADKQTMVDQVL